MSRSITTLALIIAATACASERALSPQPAAPAFAKSVGPTATQVPLLFVVDGVRYPLGQIPALYYDQIFAVRVIKGHAALKAYGPDASYGVVVITTKQAAGPRT